MEAKKKRPGGAEKGSTVGEQSGKRTVRGTKTSARPDVVVEPVLLGWVHPQPQGGAFFTSAELLHQCWGFVYEMAARGIFSFKTLPHIHLSVWFFF